MKNWITPVILQVLKEKFPNDDFYIEEKKEKLEKFDIYESLNWIETNLDSNLKKEFCKKTDFTLEDLESFHNIFVKL